MLRLLRWRTIREVLAPLFFLFLFFFSVCASLCLFVYLHHSRCAVRKGYEGWLSSGDLRIHGYTGSDITLSCAPACRFSFFIQSFVLSTGVRLEVGMLFLCITCRYPVDSQTIRQSTCTMSTILKKFREKRKLSSELDSRWGDVSISYPTEGSWNQRDQSSGNTGPGVSPEQGKRSRSSNSLERQRRGTTTRPSPSARNHDRDNPIGSPSRIPTGHYDANVRSRSRRAQRATGPGLGIGMGMGMGMPQNNCNLWDGANSDGDSSDGEVRETSTSTGGRNRYLSVNTEEPDYSRASKSPPLSVTSRMRRHSHQSSVPEWTPSIPGPTSSRHASFTSFAPSVSIGDPLPGYGSRHNSVQDRKQVYRPQPLNLEPARGQELVPSYDELYG